MITHKLERRFLGSAREWYAQTGMPIQEPVRERSPKSKIRNPKQIRNSKGGNVQSPFGYGNKADISHMA
jgi:hypothetical protein